MSGQGRNDDDEELEALLAEQAELDAALQAKESAPTSVEYGQSEDADLDSVLAEQAELDRALAAKSGDTWEPSAGVRDIVPYKIEEDVQYHPTAQALDAFGLPGAFGGALARRADAVTGAIGDAVTGRGWDYGGNLRRAEAQFAADKQKWHQESPILAPALEMASGVTSGAMMPGAALAGTAGKWVGRPAWMAAESAVEQGLRGGTAEEVEDAAAFGAGTTTALNFLGATGRLLGRGLRRLGGIKRVDADHYADNIGRVNQANMEDTQRQYLGHRQGTEEQLAKASETQRVAKDAEDQAVWDFDLASKMEGEQLQKRARLQEDATARNVGQSVMDAKRVARRELAKEQAEVVDIIDRDIPQLPWEEWRRYVETEQDKLRWLSSGDETSDAYQRLKAWAGHFERARNAGGKAAQALHWRDQAGKAARAVYAKADQAKYASAKDTPEWAIRKKITDDLKALSPDYETTMARRAAITDNLEAIDEFGGDPASIAKTFNLLDNPLHEEKLALLEWLGKHVYKSPDHYTAQLGPILDAKKVLSSRINRAVHMRGLPEYDSLVKAQRASAESLGNVSKAKTEADAFSSDLKPRLSTLVRNPDDPEIIEKLAPAASRMGVDMRKLAQDLQVKAKLTNLQRQGPGFLTTDPTMAALQGLHKLRARGGPAYKSWYDNVMQDNPQFHSAKGPLRWGAAALRGARQFGPKMPRTFNYGAMQLREQPEYWVEEEAYP